MIRIQSITDRTTESLRQRGLVKAPVRVGSTVIPSGGVASVRGTPAELADIERHRAANLIETRTISAEQWRAEEAERAEAAAAKSAPTPAPQTEYAATRPTEYPSAPASDDAPIAESEFEDVGISRKGKKRNQ